MKILFTARSTLFAQPGGDTRQIMQTAAALRELGVFVEIKLRGEKCHVNSFDLVHFFNIGRPADALWFLKDLRKPLVLSSIWVDYGAYHQVAPGLQGKLFRAAGAFGAEYFKTIARGMAQSDMAPSLAYLLKGQKRSMLQIISRAAVIFASSKSEKNRIDGAFGCAQKTEVLPLGLDSAFFPPKKEFESTKHRSGVICVGRVEGLKNQLNAIRAAENQPWQLTLIGKAAANQPDYWRECHLAASENVEFAGWLNATHLHEAYQHAKVLVLPSYFETFGLVALEALANGCQVVMADMPDMNEIFKEYVTFCQPGDFESIREAVNHALTLPPPKLAENILATFSWPLVAEKLFKTYSELINNE